MDMNKQNYWAYITSKESTTTEVKELSVTIHYKNGDHTTRGLLEQKMILAAIQSLQDTGAMPVIPREYEQSVRRQSYNPVDKCHRCNLCHKELESPFPSLHSNSIQEANQEQPSDGIHIYISSSWPH